MRPGSRKRTVRIAVAGESYDIDILREPFREGVEIYCTVDGDQIRISDRQLGLHEAVRLLGEEIARRRAR